ncbi:MAG: hypothetical protein IPL57_00965 [Rubrivivax sp.]|nr:hypothetical protein [Rubrivivax sp.]
MTTTRLRTRKTALALAVAVVLGVTPWQESLAVPCAFNPASGDWGTLGNWSCGAVPGAADTATVASGKTATVSGAQGATAISNAGTISINNNSGLGLLGTNVNDGLINLNSFGNNTDLTFSGAAALNGSGTVNMSNSSVNRILGVGATTLSIGAGQTIQGAGKIGAATAMALINNGTIVSTLSGLFINSAAGVTNNSVLRADGATLVLENTAFNQGAAGTLNALNGSVVQLSNSSITGGSFSTASGGAVATAGATFGNTLSGVTNTGTFNLVNNSGIVLGGTLTNNGSVNLISSGNVTDIALSGSRSILGSGVIALSNYANNRIYGTAGSTLTLGSGQTLTGAGVIGAGASNFALVNQGTIVASSNAGLLINASAGVTNTGTLRADGGTLSLQTTVNSGGGTIEARNGSGAAAQRCGHQQRQLLGQRSGQPDHHGECRFGHAGWRHRDRAADGGQQLRGTPDRRPDLQRHVEPELGGQLYRSDSGRRAHHRRRSDDPDVQLPEQSPVCGQCQR